jgi:hypothetical protein
MRNTFVTLGAAALIAGCASSSADSRQPTGGPVEGTADTHCGSRVRLTSMYACERGVAVQSQPGSSFGAEGSVMFGSSGADDDCKYDVSWSASEIRRDVDVTFTVIAHARGLGTSVAGAAPRAEVYLNETHPAPNTEQASVEAPAGVYRVGPVRFDATGLWVVRFHLFEQCAETSPDSPHGHAAFYVDVP